MGNGNDTATLDRDDVAFSPDGQWMPVCGIDDCFELFRFDFDSDKPLTEVARFPVGTSRTWVAFSSTSDTLISADVDQRVYHWSLSSVRKQLATFGLNWEQTDKN